jgi:alkanesulfonate monooxygenase SsuD/methylene tetrahydromethanopterin reductase-like flavin-dependent oxidoreductase (luciferase family)
VLTFPDHLVPTLSPLAGATAAAMATKRLHTGTLVLNNDLRHPVEVARESATLAAVSGGRFELQHVSTVIRALLAGEPVDVDGAHYCVRAEAGELVTAPAVRVPLPLGGNGTRVLRLAGQVADIAGFTGFAHNHGATEVRLTHFGAAGLEDRIAEVRDAAGDRLDAIELAATFGGTSPELVMDSPFVRIGTHEQMAEELIARQQRFGVSYWTVFDEWIGRPSAMPDIAKVIALLR